MKKHLAGIALAAATTVAAVGGVMAAQAAPSPTAVSPKALVQIDGSYTWSAMLTPSTPSVVLDVKDGLPGYNWGAASVKQHPWASGKRYIWMGDLFTPTWESTACPPPATPPAIPAPYCVTPIPSWISVTELDARRIRVTVDVAAAPKAPKAYEFSAAFAGVPVAAGSPEPLGWWTLRWEPSAG